MALIISVYTLVDGTAVKGHPDSALPYALSMFAIVPFVTTPCGCSPLWMGSLRPGLAEKHWRLVLGGVLGVVAYTIALFAYSFAPLNYSEAIREVSVVIGAFLGWSFLSEKMGGYRLLGAAVMFAGMLVIAVFG